MKKNSVFVLCLSLVVLLASCEAENKETPRSSAYFLSDIRPVYFDNLNFDSPTVRAQTAQFLDNFYQTYTVLENQYTKGEFTSQEDLINMQLVSQYFAFYCLALTGNYLDGNLTFAQINGNRKQGLFSGLNATAKDFEMLELKAMMAKAEKVIYRAVYFNGYNDKVYGFYVAVKQVQERLNRNNFASPAAHANAIEYVKVQLVNYDLIQNWNVLMSMVTMTNYSDSLNTFKNPQMDILLQNVNSRLIPGTLQDLGGRYPEILGPLYRFDLNLKKVDWMLEAYKTFTPEQLQEMDMYLTIMSTASTYIETQKPALLNSWLYKDTFDQRKEKLKELLEYRKNTGLLPKPALGSFIDSKAFKKAYQCYACHAKASL